MIQGVAHIGIAVADLEESLRFWRDTLGLAVEDVSVDEERGLRIALIDCGGTHIELLESVREGSVIDTFVKKRGPGVHHVSLETADLEAALGDLKESQVQLVDQEPRPGAGNTKVAFLHPRAAGGVLVELTENK